LTKFNLPTRRKTSAFSCLLLAIVMLLAGLFVSVPAQAADPNSASVSVDITNQTITYKQSFADAPIVLFVVSDARGDHNVSVPNDAAGKTETFNSTWGASARVRFLNPTTEVFESLGEYNLSSPVVTQPPVPTDKTVTFCEAIGDNSYALRTLAINVFIDGGYAENARTIAPSFTFFVNGSTATFPGLNWDEAGIAIFNNGCLPVGGTPPVETPPTTDPLPDDTDTPEKVWLCHATNPRAEAYVLIKVSVNTFLHGAGHGQHEGDIVRPFSYVKQGVAGGYPGNRWNEEGIAIFENDCSVIPAHTPSPTETVEPTETAEPTPTETATPTQTAEPSPSETTQPTETASATPTSAAPSATQEVTPSESKTAAATAKVSRYPAAMVDTAVKGGSNTASPAAPLLFSGAAAALLMALLLFRSAGHEGRRH
jgi:hypothetical protein